MIFIKTLVVCVISLNVLYQVTFYPFQMNLSTLYTLTEPQLRGFLI